MYLNSIEFGIRRIGKWASREVEVGSSISIPTSELLTCSKPLSGQLWIDGVYTVPITCLWQLTSRCSGGFQGEGR